MIDIRSFFNQVLPQTCLLCGAGSGGNALCVPCHDDLPWAGAACCPCCALSEPSGQLCGRCLKRQPAFDRTLAALDYQFPIDAVLRRYKYHGLLAVASITAELLVEQVRAAPPPDLLIAMPLHASRLQQRGFNQALEIARVIGRKLDIPLELEACKRLRATPPQAGLPLKNRIRNLRGAFSCEIALAGKHVALIDDVMTTGASLNELAKAVRTAGAQRIDCWVVARTQRDKVRGVG